MFLRRRPSPAAVHEPAALAQQQWRGVRGGREVTRVPELSPASQLASRLASRFRSPGLVPRVQASLARQRSGPLVVQLALSRGNRLQLQQLALAMLPSAPTLRLA